MRMNGHKALLLFALCLLCSSARLLYSAIPDNMAVLVPGYHVIYENQQARQVGSFVYRESDGSFFTSSYGSDFAIRCFNPQQDSEPNYPDPYQVFNVKKDDSGVSWQCADDASLLKVAGSYNVVDGTYDTYAYSMISGMVLNPKPVTVNGTFYDAGELAILSDSAETRSAQTSKRILTWDMREIGAPTDNPDPNDPNVCAAFDPLSPQYDPENLPDMANAHYSYSLLDIQKFGKHFGYGCVNWNDTFNYILTLQDMAWALGVGYVLPTDDDRSGDKRVCFSTSGKKIYFSSKDSRNDGACYIHPDTFEMICNGEGTYTGIWSLDIETKELKRLFDDSDSQGACIISSEMDVLPVGRRNLTGLPYDDSVDQILFDGSNISGNLCGMNCLVDNGSDEPSIYPVIDGFDFLNFAEIDVYSLGYYKIDLNDPETFPQHEVTEGFPFDPNNICYESYVNIEKWPKIWSITTDKDNNIYFYIRGAYGVYRYDTAGRLICIRNMPQTMTFNVDAYSELYDCSSFLDDEQSGVYNCSSYRLATRYINYGPEGSQYEMPQLMFMSSAGKTVGGINAFKPCDFDRDGIITAADVDFFETQLKRGNDVPSCYDDDYLDYLKADLNGSGRNVRYLVPEDTLPGRTDPVELGNVAVTQKDVEVFYQFVTPGNINLDDTVDMQDYLAFAANFMTYPDSAPGWAEGDFDFDDDVDMDDLLLLVESWLKYDD